jgi:hypothetical protein
MTRRNVTGTTGSVSGPPNVSSSVVVPSSVTAPVSWKVPAEVVAPVRACWMMIRTFPEGTGSPTDSHAMVAAAAARATYSLLFPGPKGMVVSALR